MRKIIEIVKELKDCVNVGYTVKTEDLNTIIDLLEKKSKKFTNNTGQINICSGNSSINSSQTIVNGREFDEET